LAIGDGRWVMAGMLALPPGVITFQCLIAVLAGQAICFRLGVRMAEALSAFLLGAAGFVSLAPSSPLVPTPTASPGSAATRARNHSTLFLRRGTVLL